MRSPRAGTQSLLNLWDVFPSSSSSSLFSSTSSCLPSGFHTVAHKVEFVADLMVLLR